MTTKLIVASNRGPVSWHREDDGSWTPKRGAGGLIVALGGALQQRPGTWVSVALEEGDREMAAANPDNAFEADTDQGTFTLRLVDVGDSYDRYYNEVANRLLWFTLHQLWAEPYEPSGIGWSDAFEDYQSVNRAVARAVIAEASGDGAVEIHLQDYHLLTAAPVIREALPDAKILLYIHTPWVHPTYLRRLPDPMIEAILDGLGACNLVGISAPEWAANLRATMSATGEGGDVDRARPPAGRTLVRDFVLGIDREGLEQVASSEAARDERSALNDAVGGRRLIVRADRTDLSKNILRGLQAFDLMLDEHPDLAQSVHFRMLMNTSRQGVAEYREYLDRCRGETERLQEKWGEDVVLLDTSENFPRVVANLQSYDVLLTNPVIDGTNLVAKEGPALNENDGVLVLSRNAGAATILGEDALLVNPFDVEEQARTLHRALTMEADERARRAAALKRAAAQGAPAEWLAAQRDALAEAIGG